MLRLRARVEAQNEIVALVVFGALLSRWFGEQEGAPVADASDYAAGSEDDVAGCAGNSRSVLEMGWVGYVDGGGRTL
jgi:hypothetical protein